MFATYDKINGRMRSIAIWCLVVGLILLICVAYAFSQKNKIG